MSARPTRDTIAALDALRSCSMDLREVRLDAQTAAATLIGARSERAKELADKIADAIAWCDRLAFIVEGDLRASAG